MTRHRAAAWLAGALLAGLLLAVLEAELALRRAVRQAR